MSETAPSTEPRVLLVDAEDRPLGTAPKLEAHLHGLRHRAFSVLIFSSAGHWLLQQRAWTKYHGGGLWTNACCSHPEPEARVSDAAAQRLDYEMGLQASLIHAFRFEYRATMPNGLIEHEVDHVYTAVSLDTPQPNPEEVAAWRWLSPEALQAELQQTPAHFTPWFRLLAVHPGLGSRALQLSAYTESVV